MKSTTFSALFLLALAYSSSSLSVVQGGQTLSHMFASTQRRNNDLNDPNNHFPNDINRPSTVSHLEWNSQIGATPQQHNQQSRQGGERNEFEPYASFPFQDDPNLPPLGQVQPFPVAGTAGSSSTSGGPPCRSRDRVYLPDMQSFLIKAPLTYQEAVQACSACGSELVLVDGTNVDRFMEAFSSLGLYGDQRLWIKSWFGERISTEGEGICPAVLVNSMMGNRLEPVEADCQTRFFALCY
ncbi:hypothetical protein BGX26_001072 [Mortierella sp. AD094]|nr:hypothetical protein BGX26_001072 [Mortierella sp. AD094]